MSSISVVRRAFSHRRLSLLPAVLFLLAVQAGPNGHHAWLHGAMSRGAGTAAGSHGQHGAGPNSSSDAPSKAPCSCIGTCHGGAASPYPGGAEAEARILPALVRRSDPVEPSDVRPGRRAYLHPYPNPPPYHG